MQDLWRVPFTAATMACIVGGSWACGIGLGIFLYFWIGLLIFGVTGLSYPRILISWLPALWNEDVLDWTRGDYQVEV